jgi:hypothetical protein
MSILEPPQDTSLQQSGVLASDGEVSVRRPSFWSLADDLEAYHETLAMVDAEIGAKTDATGRPLTPDELKMIEADRAEILGMIEQLGAQLLKKTDSLAGVIRRMNADIAEQKDERDRMADKARATEAALKWLKDYAVRTMQEHGMKTLKTTINTISVCGNGSVRPLVIGDTSHIPLPLMRVEGWVRADLWELALELVRTKTERGTRINDFNVTLVPDNAAIRKALEMPCPVCHGKDLMGTEAVPGRPNPCTGCHGTGKKTVPGCSLGERGAHLDVK